VTQTLVSAVGESLHPGPDGLRAAAGALRRAFDVDRVSISRIDEPSARFMIAASAGAPLLEPGTSLPVSTCSYFAAAAEGRAFQEPDFDRSRDFTLPLDGVVLASGFHSGCSAPIRRDGRAVGAVSLSASSHRADMTAAPDLLGEVAAVLAGGLEEDAPALPAPAVLVCGGDPLAAGGIARLVERSVGAQAEVATTLGAAVQEGRRRAPDLLLCDDHLGGRSVDEVVEVLRHAEVDAPLLVVASHDSPDSLRAAMLAGAAAYVPRREVPSKLPGALCAVRGGRTVLPAAPPPGERLTRRERELVGALDEGLRFKQVARRLGITEATAKTHARNLFRKLGATSRGEAVRAARDRGLLA
jgi:two-component system, NarL family, nitrate/nitrite response regulator NarL